MHPKVESMYERMPEALTKRFEQLDEDGEDGSLVLQHRSANLTLELAAITEYPTGQLRAIANLYAPLTRIQNPEEGIEALRMLSDLEQRLHLDGFRGIFNHYDEGVEFTYDLKVGGAIPLQRALREFAFIPYNSTLEVSIHPRTRDQGSLIKDRVERYLVGDSGSTSIGTGYEAKNPTTKIMGSSLGPLKDRTLGDRIWVEFWSEDEKALKATERDFSGMQEEVVRLYGDFELTTQIKARNKG